MTNPNSVFPPTTDTNAAPPQQHLQINSVHVKNFKRISEAEVPLNNITYLVGGNNSGKSSILQAIHTAFSCAQLFISEGGKGSIAEAELFYSPTKNFPNLGHKKVYTSKGKSGIVDFVYHEASNPTVDKKYEISIGKASNQNNVRVSLPKDDDGAIRQNIEAKDSLFSVYVPGLTGIPLREEYRSYGAILRTAASGEANLVFRNILFHIKNNKRSKDKNKIDDLERILASLMGKSVKFHIDFDENVDRYIDVRLSLDNASPIPIDLWGTGVLQVTQIVAYALLFNPTLLLIDEPDSHLHPSLQKTLVDALEEIVRTVGCQIILTTHSRHMISSATEGTRVIWMKDGRVENSDAKEIVEVLLDLGALDSFDSQAAYILYTEDSNRSALTDCIKYLEERGRIPHINILPFNGKKNTQLLASIDTGTQVLNQERRLILHRDRDFLTEEEIQTWGRPYENGRNVGSDNTGQPTGQLDPMLVFVPKLNDTESYYCQPEHLQTSLGISRQDAQQLVSRIVHENEDIFKEIFWNEREAANNSDALWPHGGSPRTDELWDPPKAGEVNWQMLQGKKLFKLLKNDPAVAIKARKVEETPSAALAEEFLSFFKSHFPEA